MSNYNVTANMLYDVMSATSCLMQATATLPSGERHGKGVRVVPEGSLALFFESFQQCRGRQFSRAAGGGQTSKTNTNKSGHTAFKYTHD